MSRILRCPVCRSKMRVPDDSMGRKTRCPRCARAVRVPANRKAKPEPVRAAAVPTMDEMAITDLQIDLATKGSAASVAVATATVHDTGDDDVIVVGDDLTGEDDVIVLEEPAGEDDVIVVEDTPSAEDGVEVVEGEPEPTLLESDRHASQFDVREDDGTKAPRRSRPARDSILANPATVRIIGAFLIFLGLCDLIGLAFASKTLYLLVLGTFGLAFLSVGIFLLVRSFARLKAVEPTVVIADEPVETIVEVNE